MKIQFRNFSGIIKNARQHTRKHMTPVQKLSTVQAVCFLVVRGLKKIMASHCSTWHLFPKPFFLWTCCVILVVPWPREHFAVFLQETTSIEEIIWLVSKVVRICFSLTCSSNTLKRIFALLFLAFLHLSLVVKLSFWNVMGILVGYLKP